MFISVTGCTEVLFSESLGFWTMSNVRNSKYKEKQRFRKWICFCLQVKGREKTLERVNLNHSITGPVL
jgi:hypothetical protein